MAAGRNEREVRIGRNQALFRDVNERVESLRNGSYPLTEIDFICECADDRCFDTLTLTVEDYEAVRAHPDTFVVRPEHVYPEAEEVVAGDNLYWIVRKLGVARQLVVAADQRRTHTPDA